MLSPLPPETSQRASTTSEATRAPVQSPPLPRYRAAAPDSQVEQSQRSEQRARLERRLAISRRRLRARTDDRSVQDSRGPRAGAAAPGVSRPQVPPENNSANTAYRPSASSCRLEEKYRPVQAASAVSARPAAHPVEGAALERERRRGRGGHEQGEEPERKESRMRCAARARSRPEKLRAGEAPRRSRIPLRPRAAVSDVGAKRALRGTRRRKPR